jgi:hypothetical protein
MEIMHKRFPFSECSWARRLEGTTAWETISVTARPALEPRDSKSAAWRLSNQR